MAGWKLRKDKTLPETPEGEAPGTAEAPSAEIPQTEAAPIEADGRTFEPDGLKRTYDLGELEESKEPAFLDAVPHFSSFDTEPEVYFTDLDFDSDLEDVSELPKNEHSEAEHFGQDDGSLTLVDYTEPEAAPKPPEFSLPGAQIFEMPPPAIEMPLPAVEMPSDEAPSFMAEASPFVMETAPFVMETAPELDAPAEEEAPLPPRIGRETGALASAPDFDFGGIPTVSPFVLDTPLASPPPAAPPQLVVRVGRLSAPFALTKDVTTIGRPDSALHYYPDVEIETDDAVSRRHAEVVRRGDSYYLADTGSTNGTLLNGEKLPPLEERLLAYGDRIRVGDRTEITFE